MDRMRSITAASLSSADPPHPVEEALLVPAVMIDGIVPESLDDLCTGSPDGLLLRRVVGPEGVARAAALGDGEQADQVIGFRSGTPSTSRYEGHVRGRHRRSVEDEDLLLAEGQDLKGGIVLAGPSRSPLAPPAGPVGVRELSDRCDPPAAQLLDLLPRESPEETQVIGRLRDPPTGARNSHSLQCWFRVSVGGPSRPRSASICSINPRT